jgi:hypothetical protein
VAGLTRSVIDLKVWSGGVREKSHRDTHELGRVGGRGPVDDAGQGERERTAQHLLARIGRPGVQSGEYGVQRRVSAVPERVR